MFNVCMFCLFPLFYFIKWMYEGMFDIKHTVTHLNYTVQFSFFFFIFLFLFFLFVVNFVIHWNKTAMGLHVFPIPIPPPTSLSTRSP